MPELPEVETTRRGIEPHIKGFTVTEVIVRQPKLRWAVPSDLQNHLPGYQFQKVLRRGKYLLLETLAGTVLIHLGMSGSLRILKTPTAPRKHDHVDFVLNSGDILRYTDPRRFGCILWEESDPAQHPLLAKLGPEPLTDEFDADYLYTLSRKRKAPIKTFVMDSAVVVGVGNIYANEALFMAGISPKRAAGAVSKARYQELVIAIKAVLGKAIKVGGTTLRDFTGGNGDPGYFKQSLQVYGRGGLPCGNCQTPLTEIRLGQRTTVYCRNCQK
ncbi:MAG: bifunctional DNA-formamidopyrimidine glycosylase/DNA-(apurinic or apyrimidinic site) lyase [Pseudohongiellaceae bacterium]